LSADGSPGITGTYSIYNYDMGVGDYLVFKNGLLVEYVYGGG
jgi:hypothetical protein